MIFHMPKKEIQILTLEIDNTNIDKVEECVQRTQRGSNKYSCSCSWKDHQGVGRRDLGNEMGHNTLPIKIIHPHSIKQTHRTRPSTALASAPEPFTN